MRLSCPEQMIRIGSPAERLRIIRESGFDGIDCRYSSLEDTDFCEALSKSSLPLASVYSQVRVPSLLDAEATGRAMALESVVHRALAAAEHGADNLILVPVFGETRFALEAELGEIIELETALLVVSVKEIGERLASSEVTVVLEPLNVKETHYLTSPTVAANLCRHVGSSKVRTMVDTYHCFEEGYDPSIEIDRVGDELALVHLSDSGRGLPGEGSIDFQAVCCRLAALDFSGWQGLECRQIKTSDDVAALVKSVGMLRSISCPA